MRGSAGTAAAAGCPISANSTNFAARGCGYGCPAVLLQTLPPSSVIMKCEAADVNMYEFYPATTPTQHLSEGEFRQVTSLATSSQFDACVYPRYQPSADSRGCGSYEARGPKEAPHNHAAA